jgi:hypothetical protein
VRKKQGVMQGVFNAWVFDGFRGVRFFDVDDRVSG